MSSTKSILPETTSFSANLIHHKERPEYSPENLPNFTNPLVSNIEEGNDISTFKEFTSEPGRLEFVEEIRNAIFVHEKYKHWNLLRRRDLKKNMSIRSFKIKR